MSWKRRSTSGLLLSLAILPCGCSRQWKVVSCYEGPVKSPSEVAIVLLHARALPVYRIRSVDHVEVDDAVEYHLPPGEHLIVTGVSNGKSSEIPMRCELRAGWVYRMTADVWNLSERLGLLSSLRVECDWRPRLIELGRFEELAADEQVHPAILGHLRVRHPFTAMVWAKQNEVAVDDQSPRAHFSGSIHFIAPLFMSIDMPPKEWGTWPRKRPIP